MMLQRYPGRLFKKCTNAAITETNASTAFCVPFLAYICPHSKYNSSIIYEKTPDAIVPPELFVVTLYLCRSCAGTFRFYFTHVNGENGLSASNVKAILQDSYGFMWFGTKTDSTAMTELPFFNLIVMIWRRVRVIIILVLFLRIKKGIYGLVQTEEFIYIIRRSMYLNVSK